MRATLCKSCRTILKARFKLKLSSLEFSRRCTSSQSLYWDTTPPTSQQLAVARWFFQQHSPKKLWTATEWRKSNDDLSGILVPEVVFLGRSNVGKSSLLNAVLNSPGLNRVGPRPGKTKIMHAWGLSATNASGGALKGWKGMTDTRVAVLDAPGYGYASKTDWGNEIIVYLKRRQQVRRVFVLIDSLHGAKQLDQQMLELLRNHAIPHQLIACKIDRQKDIRNAMEALRGLIRPQQSNHAMTALGEILGVGGLEQRSRWIGVDDVQWAILHAAGLEDLAFENYKRLVKLDKAPQSINTQSTNALSETQPPSRSGESTIQNRTVQQPIPMSEQVNRSNQIPNHR